MTMGRSCFVGRACAWVSIGLLRAPSPRGASQPVLQRHALHSLCMASVARHSRAIVAVGCINLHGAHLGHQDLRREGQHVALHAQLMEPWRPRAQQPWHEVDPPAPHTQRQQQLRCSP